MEMIAREESHVLSMEISMVYGVQASVYRIGGRCGKKDAIQFTPRSCKFRVC